MPECLIGLGSNLGDRHKTLEKSICFLDREPDVRLIRKSGWYITAPMGGPAGQDPFLNGVVLVETSRSAKALLALLRQIEVRLGRQRTERWGSRSVDLDLLLYGTQVIQTPELIVPHPRMAWRRFVLEPASEVARSMCHPTIGWTIGRLLEHLNEARPYVAIAGLIGVGRTFLADQLSERISARRILEPENPTQSESFRADPTGHTRAVELEFLDDLERKAHLLDGSSNAWSDLDRPVVSDFWFAQSLVYADMWLPMGLRDTFRRHWTKIEPTVVRPKLIVLLDVPFDTRLDERFDVDTLERERRAIRDLAKRPGWGPMIELDVKDPDWTVSEVVTAVKSME